MSELFKENCWVNDFLSANFDSVDGLDFYTHIFPDNEYAGIPADDFSTPNAIYLYTSPKDYSSKRTLRRRIMLKNTWEDDYISFVAGNPKTLCSGLSYRGRANTLNKAQNMNALIIDLDSVGLEEVKLLCKRFSGDPSLGNRFLPLVSYIVSSGTGLHLYYVFSEPIALFPNIKVQLKNLKNALTFKIWEFGSTSRDSEIQYQSINQGFRMVGSINDKYDVPIRAYKVGDKVSLEYLNSYVKDESKVDINKRYKKSVMSLDEAKKAYPEWYKNKIVLKKKDLNKWDIAGKVNGNDPYALYHWWLRQADDIKGGHRYFFLMCMAIYASKCNYPREDLKNDMYIVFDNLAKIPYKNDLTEEDLLSAMKIYDKNYYNFTIKDIEKLTGLRIERNIRKYRKRSEHIKVMNAIREITYPNNSWINKDGRPKGSKNKRNIKYDILKEYIVNNPTVSNKSKIARETGVTRPTVIKWYNIIKNE